MKLAFIAVPGCDKASPVLIHYNISEGIGALSMGSGSDCQDMHSMRSGYQYSAKCQWSSTLVLKDSTEETVSLDVGASLANYEFLNVVVEYTQDGEVLVFKARVAGGTQPYRIKWGSGTLNNLTTLGLPLLEMPFQVTDSNACTIAYSPYLDGRDPWCPDLFPCAHLPGSFRVSCYKRLCWDAMTGKSDWHHCSARAAMRMVMALRKTHLAVVDHGAAFFALRLLKGSRLPRQLIRQFLEYDQDLLLLFDGYVRGHLGYKELLTKSLAYMVGLKAKHLPPIDTLIVSPAGFYNEPIFAPQLAHGQRRVAVMVTKEGVFPSSMVTCLVSPLTLEFDVDLASMFLRAVLDLLKPRWIFPGDSEGILIIAKATNAPYPPRMLGKLPPGHEIFSPAEIVISEDDGIRTIGVDLEHAKRALEALGGSVYLKREYSDAGRGVASVMTSTNLESTIATLMQRVVGVDQMDLSIPVRLFLQKRVDLGESPKIYGFRFYARNGTVVAAHTSRLVQHVAAHALEYVTVRDEQVEKSSIAYIASQGYDGFGAAWWFFDVNLGPMLLDFNARVERHACISAVLQGSEKLLCPCVYFALGLTAPFTPVPAGRKYTDPIRMSRSDKHFTASLWNVRREDEKLMAWIRERHKREPLPVEDEEMFIFE